METEIILSEDVVEMDLYEILEISQNSTFSEIKNAHRKLVLKYHPDKKTGDSDKFQNITKAYDILSDDELRTKYDNMYLALKNKIRDFNELKSSYKNHLIENNLSNEELEKQNHIFQFKEKNDELDREYGYNKDDIISLSENDIKQKLESLQNERDNICIQSPKIFNNFNQIDFNKVFDQQDKLSQTQSGLTHSCLDNTLVNTDVVSINSLITYAGLNQSGLYNNDDINNYATLENSFNITDISAIDLKNLEKIPDNFTKHNKFSEGIETYNNNIDKKMEEYQNQTSKFQNMKLCDFKKDNNDNILNNL